MFEQITANIVGRIRREKLEGRNHLVAPVSILAEGVLNGSNGPVLYLLEDMQKYLPSWNHKPIVNYHPKKNGEFTSADDPEILSLSKTGILMANRISGKFQHADAWFDEERLKLVDIRVYNALVKNIMVSVSTGLFGDYEEKKAEWFGKPYERILRNYRPDHLATLPDMAGACSLADGCGILNVNEAIPIEQMERVQQAAEKAWKGELITTNCSCGGHNVNEDKNMKFDKTAAIAALIAGPAFNAEDKDWLEKLEDKKIEKLFKASTPKQEDSPKPNANEEAEKKDAKEKADKEAADKVAAATATANQQQLPPKQVTVQEYIASAPKEIQAVLANGLMAHEQEKTNLITVITGNKKNLFTKEQLASFELPVLRNMAALAQEQVQTTQQQQAPFGYDYSGGAGAPIQNQEVKEEGLMVPILNFNREKKTA